MPKRKPPSADTPAVKRIFPKIQWRLCEQCNEEFRRMCGWQFVTGPYTPAYGGLDLPPVGWHKYLCADCAPCKGDAEAMAEVIRARCG